MKGLTIREVAEKLGKSEDWIKEKIRSNELKAKKEGKEYKINKKDIEKYKDEIKNKVDRF
ncbi:MAG: helix-turn-helix domain-containing protein [Halanaerobiales bacterium]|nr:helix-turn-helix domain-containing protein [Halanaerobiales bacterium]